MSRRSWSGPPATQAGYVYTLHLSPPLGHAKHYTGWAADLDERLAKHDRGAGARLLQVQHGRGGSFDLADVERGTRQREAQLKQRGASRRCPICQAQQALAETQPEQEAEAG